MKKIFILILTLIFLTGCGFQRVSNDKHNNFQIKNFLVTGDTKIANLIKNDIIINVRKNSSNLISLSLNIKKSKTISEKNSANQVTKYSINLVADLVDYDGEIIWDSSKPDGTPKKQLDVKKINSIGWRSKIPLEQGLRDTIRQFLDENYEGFKQ